MIAFVQVDVITWQVTVMKPLVVRSVHKSVVVEHHLMFFSVSITPAFFLSYRFGRCSLMMVRRLGREYFGSTTFMIS